ncbi:MAG: hypothetical protein K2X27_08790, partial [Candidatus Obscuribacterales bacterium]|nr:hypothetical protein [Candidatus Obscuribacterales bacterium]
HAGQSELLRWLDAMARNKARVVLSHGEDFQISQLAAKIKSIYGIEAETPRIGESITL